MLTQSFGTLNRMSTEYKSSKNLLGHGSKRHFDRFIFLDSRLLSKSKGSLNQTRLSIILGWGDGWQTTIFRHDIILDHFSF